MRRKGEQSEKATVTGRVTIMIYYQQKINTSSKAKWMAIFHPPSLSHNVAEWELDINRQCQCDCIFVAALEDESWGFLKSSLPSSYLWVWVINQMEKKRWSFDWDYVQISALNPLQPCLQSQSVHAGCGEHGSALCVKASGHCRQHCQDPSSPTCLFPVFPGHYWVNPHPLHPGAKDISTMEKDHKGASQEQFLSLPCGWMTPVPQPPPAPEYYMAILVCIRHVLSCILFVFLWSCLILCVFRSRLVFICLLIALYMNNVKTNSYHVTLMAISDLNPWIPVVLSYEITGLSNKTVRELILKVEFNYWIQIQ